MKALRKLAKGPLVARHSYSKYLFVPKSLMKESGFIFLFLFLDCLRICFYAGFNPCALGLCDIDFPFFKLLLIDDGLKKKKSGKRVFPPFQV